MTSLEGVSTLARIGLAELEITRRRETVLSRRISGSPNSFEVTGSAREDQAATVGTRARKTA